MFRAGVLDPKPTRPYRSLAEFRTKVVWPHTLSRERLEENPDKWPCLECKAIGTIYDPEDPPCPVEGNKLRNRIKCPGCGGTRFGPKAKVVEAYGKALAEFKEKLRRWEERKATLRSAWRKLTPAERKVVGLI